MQTNNAHEYTDAQIQSAIDAACEKSTLNQLYLVPNTQDWCHEAPNRLAIARAFLAALPKPAEADPYARLKAYAKSGARIRTHDTEWTNDVDWSWCLRPEHYEVHPDDLHLCPEYAPKAAPWTLPAEVNAEPEQAAEEKPCGLNSALDEWSADDGPQAVSKEAPDTFEAHGKTWTRHTPGDPCLCDPSALVYVAFKDGTFSSGPDFAEVWGWGTVLTENEWIIGWRYADEPAKAEAKAFSWADAVPENPAVTEQRKIRQAYDTSKQPAQPTQSQQAWTPRPGDVVRLKSGGDVYTVMRYMVEKGEWSCVASPNCGVSYLCVPAACLTPAKEGQP